MYIRTKDGRIIDTTKIVTGSNFMDFATNDESFREIFKTEPLSKSENLEELCDLFYLDRGGDIDINDFYDKYQFDVAKEYYLEEVKHFVPIKLKAYIDTDKGLIYVAKMNDKGELELI